MLSTWLISFVQAPANVTFYKIHMYHHQTSVWLDFDSAMILSPRLVLPPPVFVVKSNNSPPYATTDFVSRITPRT